MGNGVTSSVQTYGTFDVNSLDPILAPHIMSGSKWGSSSLFRGVDLTFSFSGPGSYYVTGYGENEQTGLFALNAQQKTAAMNAMDNYSDVADIDFSEVSESSTQAGDIRWANTNSINVPTAQAYHPGSVAQAGDIWFGTQDGGYGSPSPGNYHNLTFLHELGHAVGLKHPHDEPPYGPPSRDAVKFTVMSYRDHVGDTLDGYESSFLPTTLMIDDIIALQIMYGENLAINSGNTTYTYGVSEKVFETIWDGSGTDTINASNQALGVIINLIPGTFSSIGSAFSNGSTMVRDCLGIAYSCDIENATGSAHNDTLLGNSLANVLNGGGGTDSMFGGLGNDIYVTNGGDAITESAGAGSDTVQSSVGHVLGSNLENVTLIGSGAINAVGNSLNNVITGNGAANILNGSGGADRLVGGLGNDTYVTTGGDTIVEGGVAGAGTDTVQSSVGYVLGSNLENLMLIGTVAANGVGNSANNVMTGNDANNTLNGSGGADTMIGKLGNDTYVTTGGDTITEAASAGTDTVQSTVTYTLGSNLENLTLIGSAGINGSGNAFNNIITGNAGNNILNGSTGKDTLYGGAGNDGFRFTSALSASTNVDTIADFSTVNDSIQLYNGVFTRLSAYTGTLNAAHFRANTTGEAADVNDFIIYETDTGKIFYDVDGNGAHAKTQFALVGVSTHAALTVADFVVI